MTCKVQIRTVSGQRVRDNIDINFTIAGHDKVYPYIPKGQVWIERGVSKRERPLIALHELTERHLMCDSAFRKHVLSRRRFKELSEQYKTHNRKEIMYREAHRIATESESIGRRHPKLVKQMLKKVM
jgi:hypothetical protein